MMADAQQPGQVRSRLQPGAVATAVVHTVSFLVGVSSAGHDHPVTATEAWDSCEGGLIRGWPCGHDSGRAHEDFGHRPSRA